MLQGTIQHATWHVTCHRLHGHRYQSPDDSAVMSELLQWNLDRFISNVETVAPAFRFLVHDGDFSMNKSYWWQDNRLKAENTSDSTCACIWNVIIINMNAKTFISQPSVKAKESILYKTLNRPITHVKFHVNRFRGFGALIIPNLLFSFDLAACGCDYCLTVGLIL